MTISLQKLPKHLQTYNSVESQVSRVMLSSDVLEKIFMFLSVIRLFQLSCFSK